jgi:hypothetical protein
MTEGGFTGTGIALIGGDDVLVYLRDDFAHLPLRRLARASAYARLGGRAASGSRSRRTSPT